MDCLTFAISVCTTTKLLSLQFLTGSAAILQVTWDCYSIASKDSTIGWERRYDWAEKLR
jgi:hypothetical protein